MREGGREGGRERGEGGSEGGRRGGVLDGSSASVCSCCLSLDTKTLTPSPIPSNYASEHTI